MSLGLGLVVCATGLGILACDAWKANSAFDSLQIVQVQSISGSGSGAGMCVVSGTAAGTASPVQGTLDVFLPDGSFPPYLLPLLVANNLDPVGGTKATEMNNMILTHFSITLSAPGMTWSSDCPASFDSEQFTIPLAPGGTAGYPLYIIKGVHSACLLAHLAPDPSTDPGPRSITVTAHITAKGTHGGTTIESAAFLFNVEVCTGCLQQGYNQADLAVYDYPAGYPACSSLTGSNPYQGDQSGCLAPGQDNLILCCGLTDASGRQRAICPAVPTGTTSTTTSTSTSTATTP